MKNQMSLDNELALKILEVLKGQTYYVAQESIKLAQQIMERTALVVAK
ncbi:MAG: hypothetical protein WC756_06760 [Taibaiella sp.]|jgi:hypothetical protein